MFREKCKIIENKKVAPGHYVLKLASPRISKNARPGQFVQILCADSTDPLLPRPFSFLTASKKDFSILYQVVGNGTKILSQAAKGDSLWILGPLGNGFSKAQKGEDLVLVGGGVGIPPLYHLAQALVNRTTSVRSGSWHRTWSDKPNNIHVFLGARNKSLLLYERDFKKLGVNLHIATDDGSKGSKGFVTEILEGFLKSRQRTPAKIYTCGPTPMLKAVSLVSQKYQVPCEVSVEVPMACGFGACLGCAIEVDDSRGRRFAVACTEGPVFQAKEIIW